MRTPYVCMCVCCVQLYRKPASLFAKLLTVSKSNLNPLCEQNRTFFWITACFFFYLQNFFFIKTCKCLLCRCFASAQTTKSALTHGNHRNFRHIQNVNAGPLTKISLGLSKSSKNFCLKTQKKKKNKTCLKCAQKWNFLFLPKKKLKSKRILPATCVITNSFVECTSVYSFCEFCRAHFTFNLFSTPKNI